MFCFYNVEIYARNEKFIGSGFNTRVRLCIVYVFCVEANSSYCQKMLKNLRIATKFGEDLLLQPEKEFLKMQQCVRYLWFTLVYLAN